MRMNAIGYYNGTIGALDEIKIPLLDRAVYFGDGCYEACFVQNKKAFELEAHLDRFEQSMALLKIVPPKSREALKAALSDCMAAYGPDTGLLYWQCSRGTAKRQHNFPDASVPSNLAIMITPKPRPEAHGTVRLMTAKDIRFTMCNVKTLNLLPNVLINQQATEQGYDEAIFVRDGIVTECTHSNVHLLKDGALWTHPTDRYILPGITRMGLIGICNALGVPVREEPFPKEALFTADEVLISASGAGVRSATEIDGAPVGGKATALLHLLQDEYDRKLTEETRA